jgi:chromosomal replication initiator protein
MQAIGNALFKQNPNLKILYVSAESFMNEYIESLQKKTTDAFRKKYRYLDLLLIDDIQSISGKEATQDEIFNTFNALHQAEKQIILTSDRRPEEIEKVESRIISRFMGGLTVDIQIPDFETRAAIITEKLSFKGLTWNREVIEYVADQVVSNIRELEGTINTILGQSLIKGPVNLEMVRDVLGPPKETINTRTGKTPPKTIISTIAKHYGVKLPDLLGTSREAIFVKPRQMAMYFLRVECKLNYEEVAGLLNKNDHTTVIHAVKKLELAYKNDPKVREQMGTIKREIWG